MLEEMDGRLIEWDDRKNEINRRKHGIDFEDAGLVFADEARIEMFDELHSDEEDRYITIGRVEHPVRCLHRTPRTPFYPFDISAKS